MNDLSLFLTKVKWFKPYESFKSKISFICLVEQMAVWSAMPLVIFNTINSFYYQHITFTKIVYMLACLETLMLGLSKSYYDSICITI